MQTGSALPSQSLAVKARLRIAGMVLLAQMTGFVCAALLLGFLGFASSMLAVSISPAIELVLYLLCIIGCPVLCSWWVLTRYASHVRPLITSLSSYIVAMSGLAPI